MTHVNERKEEKKIVSFYVVVNLRHDDDPIVSNELRSMHDHKSFCRTKKKTTSFCIVVNLRHDDDPMASDESVFPNGRKKIAFQFCAIVILDGSCVLQPYCLTSAATSHCCLTTAKMSIDLTK